MGVIRVGVFFDGTGNNMWNDMAINDGSLSNVAKLYQLYDNVGYTTFYAEGVGTEAYTQGDTFSEAQIAAIRNPDSELRVDRIDLYKDSGGTSGLMFGEGMKDLINKKLAEVKAYIKLHPDDDKKRGQVSNFK